MKVELKRRGEKAVLIGTGYGGATLDQEILVDVLLPEVPTS